MDTFLFTLAALVVGIALGWFLANRGGNGQDSAEHRIALAASQEAVKRLEAQINEATRERLEREARDKEENRLITELAPVKENLEKMSKVVADLQEERAKQVGEISTQIREVIQSNDKIRLEANQLSRALTSNSVRGVWGETQLRRLIELAGLLKHADFGEQVTIKGGESSGRADVMIYLPGGKSLAIDSKVPFNKYQEASAISELADGEEGERRRNLIKEHVKAVKKHVDDLATREYWSGLDASPDFVIAFVPSESLLSAALDMDPTLLEYAFKKNVALASPVSVFSVLKTINYIWRQNADESQLRNMIRLGKELYERVGKVAELADKLGRSLTGAVKDYNQFVSSLEKRMLVTARKLNDLDENELGLGTIESPKAIETAAEAFTASEVIDAEIVDEEDSTGGK
jgi:DNA recombination protein RmuC